MTVAALTGSPAHSQPGNSLDEQTLVRKMRSGDHRAFDRFFDHYVARISAFAARRTRLDSAALEDIVQVTLIKAVNGLDSFRGDSPLFTWLCGICRNQLADIRRKAARQPFTQSLEELEASRRSETVSDLASSWDPLDESELDSERSAVRHTVNQLPASYAQILELRYGDDLSVLEIARTLQLSESATESRLVRARQAFRAGWVRETSNALS